LKQLQGKKGKPLEDTGIDNYLLNRTPAVQEIRERTDIWDYLELKSLCIKSN
jgi:hypothetical protein